MRIVEVAAPQLHVSMFDEERNDRAKTGLQQRVGNSHYSVNLNRYILTYFGSTFYCLAERSDKDTGSCHKRQKPQAPTPQAPIRNRQMRKVANAKGLNRNTNLS